jgi:hypothetical protein
VDGRIWVEPNAAAGSRFLVEIPLAPEPAASRLPGRRREAAGAKG